MLSCVSAILRPRYRVYFGRKAYVPSRSLLLPGTVPRPYTLETVIEEHAWLEPSCQALNRAAAQPRRAALRTVIECPADHPEAHLRNDHPVSFTPGNRLHSPRSVLLSETPLTEAMISNGRPLCS